MYTHAARRASRSSPALLIWGATVAAALIAGCAGCAVTTPPQTDAPVPHGYVEGAAEMSEAQTGLAYVANGARELALFDLATETEQTVALQVTAEAMYEDGRFVYVSDARGALEVIDTGVWTVDHGDHVHYYQAEPRSLGVLHFDAPVRDVIGHGTRTTVSAGQDVKLLDRHALENGELRELGTLEDSDFAVPFDVRLLLANATGVTVVDEEGAVVSEVGAECIDPAGWAILRSGTVIGCENGVLLVKSTGVEVTATLLPYTGSDARAEAFVSRPRSNEAAAVAGAGGAWSVDAAGETLTFVPLSEPATAVASPANSAHVLSLGEAGTLRSVELDTGEEVAARPGFASRPAEEHPAGSSNGVISLDPSRAYVVAADPRTVAEIDYVDELRVARTLELSQQPDLMLEIGR